MSMPKGKHVTIDMMHPPGVGICDYSGFPFNHQDLIKQYDWRGNALVWTGYMVGRPYLDDPQPQARPPILRPDPIPLKNPRLPQGSTETYVNNTLPVYSQALVPYDQVSSNSYAVLPIPYTQRIQNLNAGIPVVLPSNGAALYSIENQLSPQQIIQDLEEVNWSD